METFPSVPGQFGPRPLGRGAEGPRVSEPDGRRQGCPCGRGSTESAARGVCGSARPGLTGLPGWARARRATRGGARGGAGGAAPAALGPEAAREGSARPSQTAEAGAAVPPPPRPAPGAAMGAAARPGPCPAPRRSRSFPARRTRERPGDRGHPAARRGLGASRRSETWWGEQRALEDPKFGIL